MFLFNARTNRKPMTLTQALVLPIALPVLAVALVIFGVPELCRMALQRRRLGFWG